MEIVINGQAREVPEASTVAALVAEMVLNQRYVAIEVNEQLVPRTAHADCVLRAGDRVEIVTLVGGG